VRPFDVILFDIGGVLLTNGWDHGDREQIFNRFGIDVTDYQERQSKLYEPWDTGRITADQFLSETIFHCPRPFTREEFWQAVLACSQWLEDGALGILEEIVASNRYLVGALNNEPRETNQYRFEHFGLSRWLRVRLSSCYLGLRKPDLAYYRRAIEILGVLPERILFIDDRIVNVEAAQQVGLRALHYEGAQKLRGELEELGVLAVK
jgi:putative hydrolase of the HAD superfamily